MRSLTQLVGLPLQWRQPHLMAPAFELKYSEEVLATLVFKNSFGSLAEGTIAEGTWTFKREGFLNTHVTVRLKDNPTNMGIFRNNTWSGGGTLQLADGRLFQANSNFWHSQFEFTNEAGMALIRYTNISGFKLHSQLDILKPAAETPEMPWMVVLGWYLAVMTSRDGEMVAALF
ncbi:MAG: hypothetical protein IPH84_03005 [Bacteroidales bacterium]|nr:hypothetical protein [Bacteroidales bacterium]